MELYMKVLARLEADYNREECPDLVREAFSLLWAARRGLTENELLDLLEIPQVIWSPLFVAIQDAQEALVSRKGGLLNFFHDYMRQAAERRYLSDHEVRKAAHLRLADFFEKQEINSRTADELPYHLENADAFERLKACISGILMFRQFMREGKEYELWGYWLRTGMGHEMVAAYQAALNTYEKTEPEVDNLASVLNLIAALFWKAGFFDAAIPMLRQALEISEKVLGADHPSTATSLNNLGTMLQDKGDYEGAEPLYRRALEIREKVFGADHPETATSLNNLALLMKAKGDYEGAEPLFRRALEIREKVFGADHPETATSLNNLALLLQAKGDYEGAEPLFRRALEIREKVFGAFTTVHFL
ncbi:Tetratricopeptide repeat-containing protein [Desulfonema magnum]|uniref:Tetratricopeptide repeat-containing protein n=1 Tax=Desulfonema magnum TaxID=45655 RepID=A0A975BYZ1_9BACT|nr:Tetratricopeptide repeat-containing protein [Desulfonema magnum]